MPDHIGKTLANALKTTLEGINGSSGGYNNDLTTGTRVFLFGRGESQVNDRPSIIVRHAGEVVTTSGDEGAKAGTRMRRLLYTLELMLSEGDASEASDVFWDMLYDVEKALSADETLGVSGGCDLKIGEEAGTIEVTIQDVALPDFVAHVPIAIEYDTGTKDPAVTTPSAP